MEVLIVEDDASTRGILDHYLREWKNAQCDSAKNEAEARQMINKKRYDLIVLDLLLDGVLSTSLIGYTRHLWLNQPPLVCVVSAMQDGERIALENKADKFMSKPFTLEMLDELVEDQTKSN